MEQIFRTARSTLIQPGPAANGSDNAMEFLKHQQIVKNQAEVDSHDNSRQQHQALAEIHTENLREVLERDYWSRLWVIQEVLLSKYITVMCGSKSVPWDTFDAFLWDVQDVEACESLKWKRIIDKLDGTELKVDWSPWKL